MTTMANQLPIAQTSGFRSHPGIMTEQGADSVAMAAALYAEEGTVMEPHEEADNESDIDIDGLDSDDEYLDIEDVSSSEDGGSVADHMEVANDLAMAHANHVAESRLKHSYPTRSPAM